MTIRFSTIVPLLGDELPQRFDDLRFFGKTADGELGKEDASIGDNVENTAASADQIDGEVQFFLDRACQTGGPRFVVSFTAVGNGDFHSVTPLRQSPG